MARPRHNLRSATRIKLEKIARMEILGQSPRQIAAEMNLQLIREPKTLATEHLTQHLNLFFLVRDDRLLVSVDPTGKHQHQQLPRRTPRFRLHGYDFTLDANRKR